MNTRSVLEDEIGRISAKLNEMEPGTEEYEKLSNLLHKYIDRRTELEKLIMMLMRKLLPEKRVTSLRHSNLMRLRKTVLLKWLCGL